MITCPSKAAPSLKRPEPAKKIKKSVPVDNRLGNYISCYDDLKRKNHMCGKYNSGGVKIGITPKNTSNSTIIDLTNVEDSFQSLDDSIIDDRDIYSGNTCTNNENAYKINKDITIDSDHFDLKNCTFDDLKVDYAYYTCRPDSEFLPFETEIKLRSSNFVEQQQQQQQPQHQKEPNIQKNKIEILSSTKIETVTTKSLQSSPVLPLKKSSTRKILKAKASTQRASVSTSKKSSPAINVHQLKKSLKRPAEDQLDRNVSDDFLKTLKNSNSSNSNSNASKRAKLNPTLRPIIIDGPNVAYEYGEKMVSNKKLKTSRGKSRNKKIFSFKGIELAYNYFKNRGHKFVAVSLPNLNFLKNPDQTKLCSDSLKILSEFQLIHPCPLFFARCRQVGFNGHFINNHDDLNIFSIERTVPEFDGAIVVTNDFFRDINEIAKRDDDSRKIQIIELQLLNFNFFMGHFLPPDDPLGRGHAYDFESIQSKENVKAPVRGKKNLITRRKIVRLKRGESIRNGMNFITLDEFLKF